jgi:hypothetical protein
MADLRNIPPDVADALAKGRLIEAMRLLRGRYNVGLAEAKALLEALQQQQRQRPNVDMNVKTSLRTVIKPAPVAGIARRPGLSPGEVPRGPGSGEIAAVVVLVLIAIGLAVHLLDG